MPAVVEEDGAFRCRRLNLLYSEYCGELALYSIDESFIYLPDWQNGGYTETAHEIRNRAIQEIHVPVSVGIAPAKTLAKLCNKLAKRYGSVCSWKELSVESPLKSCPVADVRGIGHAKTELLTRLGVHTAYDLATFPLDKAKKHLSITGFRTVQELNGIRALDRNELFFFCVFRIVNYQHSPSVRPLSGLKFNSFWLLSIFYTASFNFTSFWWCL